MPTSLQELNTLHIFVDLVFRCYGKWDLGSYISWCLWICSWHLLYMNAFSQFRGRKCFRCRKALENWLKQPPFITAEVWMLEEHGIIKVVEVTSEVGKLLLYFLMRAFIYLFFLPWVVYGIWQIVTNGWNKHFPIVMMSQGLTAAQLLRF